MTNSILGFRPPEFVDPLTTFAKVQQIRQLMRDNQLGDEKLAEYERARQEEGAVRNYLAQQPDLEAGQHRNALLGMGGTGRAVVKAYDEGQNTRAQASERTAQASRYGAEAVKVAFDNSRTLLGNAQTADDLMRAHLANHADPVIGPWLKSRGIDVKDGIAAIQAAAQAGPEALRQFKMQSAMSLDKVASTLYNEQLARESVTRAANDTTRASSDTIRTTNDTARVDIARKNAATAATRAANSSGAVGVGEVDPKTVAKEQAKLYVTYGSASAALRNANQGYDQTINTIDRLLANDKGMESVTGKIYGSAVGQMLTTSKEGLRAQNDIDFLKNKSLLMTLEALKSASKTGASGFGALSEREGARLEMAKANLMQAKTKQDFTIALRDLRDAMVDSQTSVKQAFDDTYRFMNKSADDVYGARYGGAEPRAARTDVLNTPQSRSQTVPAAVTGVAPQRKPAPPKSGDVVDGYRFVGGDPSKSTSWQKVP